MDADEKVKLQNRLKRVSGQVAGVQRMVDDDRYCIDVLLQISAARAALAKAAGVLLENHLQTCVRTAFETNKPAEREAKIAELLEVFHKASNR